MEEKLHTTSLEELHAGTGCRVSGFELQKVAQYVSFYSGFLLAEEEAPNPLNLSRPLSRGQ